MESEFFTADNEVKPGAGDRWIWPFKHMKPGDWFFVRHEHRDPERVRQMAGVRGAQLDKHFSVEKHWQKGACKVTCVEEGHKQYAKPVTELDFGAASELVGRCYGIDPNTLAWTLLDVGQVHRIEVEQIEKPYCAAYGVSIPDQWKFVLALNADGIELTRIEKWDTIESFTKRQLASIMD